MKVLTLALLFALTACKTSDQPSTGSAASSIPGSVERRSETGDVPRTNPPPPALPALPAQPDARADRPEWRQRADRDGARALTDEERKQRWAERREARMQHLDTNGDGQISEQERAEARTERAANAHSRFDTNEDGKLTVDELAGTRWFRGDASKADSNADGNISIEELQNAMAQNRQRGPRGDATDR